ncbi:MAG: hypothetical protein E7310_06305 [Clostridiales bacterium]|nr:hypothetical protein [Clostridiales bacterium]
MNLQERLDLLLKERKTNAWEISLKTKVPYNTIKSILEGKTANMRVDTASTIAKALGVSIDFLLGNTTFENPKLYIEEELSKLNLTDEIYDALLDSYLVAPVINLGILNPENDSDDPKTQKLKEAFGLVFKVYLNYHACRPIDFEIDMSDEESIEKARKLTEPIDNDFKAILKDLDRKKILNNNYLNIDNIITIPVVGKISAGLPLSANENIEDYEFAPSSRLNKDYDYFYLIVNGDSMNRMFPHGSRVLVQKQSDLENGDIGVIRVNGDDATVKRFKKEGNIIILEPLSTNSKHQLQIYNPEEIEIEIIGKVISYTCNI